MPFSLALLARLGITTKIAAPMFDTVQGSVELNTELF
jgi:hypothetical protein